MDITSTMTWIFSQFLRIIQFFLDTLDSINQLEEEINKSSDKSAYEYRARKESRNNENKD